jgi:serine/threonine-protein kinase
LAKKPNQRPESASSLAIRAEALLREKRRPGYSSPSYTIGKDETAATEVIPTDTAPLPKAPIVWPWLATLGLLLVTAVVVIVAILSEPDTDSIPSPSPTSSVTEEPTTGSSTVSAEPTESPVVLILRSDIIGQNLSDVTARLTELGMKVNAIPGELIPGTDPRVRTVYAVSPTGNIDRGTVVDVTYYVGEVSNLPVEIPEDPAEPGSESGTVIEGETDSPTVTGDQ